MEVGTLKEAEATAEVEPICHIRRLIWLLFILTERKEKSNREKFYFKKKLTPFSSYLYDNKKKRIKLFYIHPSLFYDKL